MGLFLLLNMLNVFLGIITFVKSYFQKQQKN